MKEYRNLIILGVLFAICFAGVVHGSHDGDKELLAFAIDSAKQILAAILMAMTIEVRNMMSRKSDVLPPSTTKGPESV